MSAASVALLRELARKMGVCESTVSLALQNHPKEIEREQERPLDSGHQRTLATLSTIDNSVRSTRA